MNARITVVLCLLWIAVPCTHLSASGFDAEDHLARAVEWEARGQPDRAAIEYGRALAARPDDAYTLCALGRLLLFEGNETQATERFEAALAVDPGNLLAMELLGMAALGRDDTEEAYALFSSVLDLDPKRSHAHLGMAVARLSQGENEVAFEHLFAALETAQSDPEESALVRDVFSWIGLAHSARLAQERVVQARPRDPAAVADLGWRLLADGDESLADSAFRQALRLDPLRAEAALPLAWMLLDAASRLEESGSRERAARLADEARRLLNSIVP